MNKQKDLFFYMSYDIYLIVYIIETSFYAKYLISLNKIIIFICLSLLMINEIANKRISNKKISYKEITLFAICLVGTFMMRKNYNGGTLFLLFFFIYEARNIELKKIVKCTYKISAILLIFIIASSKAGIIPNYISKVEGRKRQYIGFTYALYPSMIMFHITACFAYLKENKIKLYNIIILCICNYVIYRYTESRLSFGLSIILLVIAYLLPRLKVLKSKEILNILVVSFLICTIFSYAFTLNYNGNSEFYRNIDKKLNYRLYWGNNYISQHRITLFGNGEQFVGAGLNYDGTQSVGKYNYVDNFYLNIMIKYGIIYLILYLAMNTYCLILCKKQKNIILMYILAMYAVHGIIDDLMINLYYNCFELAIGRVIMIEVINRQKKKLNRG